MVAESLEREIRDLRSLLFSERDPEGRGFAPLADALRRAGDLGQALELVEEGVARLPDYATGHVVSGWIHRARGNVDEAERSFRRVLELDDENVSALRGLGFLLADRGADAEALEVFRRLDDLEPGDPEVRARLLELDRAGAEAPPAGAAAGEAADPGSAAAEAVPIASLAPDGAEPPLVDIGALAPGEGAAVVREGAAAGNGGEGAVVDIRDLAPDVGRHGPVVDIAILAPSEGAVPRSSEDLTSVPEAAPPGAEEPIVAEQPSEGEIVPLPAPAPEGPEDAEAAEGEGPWTRTMAELFLRQGLTDRAVRIYRRLVEESPGDETLRVRLRELEAEGVEAARAPDGPVKPEVYVPPDAVSGEEGEARLEDLARHMAAGPEMDDEPEGPFAWGGTPGPDEEEAGAASPSEASVSEYFRSLLAWERTPGERRAGAGPSGGLEGEAEGSGEGGSPTADDP